ncbi:MAG: hypothetical protein ABR954_05425 [Dehalococcoidales bacterium]
MARTQRWADWMFRRTDENFSILDVVKSGTIDFKLAGLLWLLMEHRASVMVAAGPVWAGKTTLFHALLDFLRPEIEQVSLRGYDEDFKSLGNDKPENTYLITEEISNHSYEYLWGYQVTKAFELLPKGYALGGTIHARNIREVAYVLNALGVPLPLIATLGVIITLQVTRGRSYYDEPLRYVDTVSTFNITKDGLVAQILVTRHLPDEKFIYTPEQLLHDNLFNKFPIKYSSVSSEMELRGHYLSQLDNRGVSSREEVRKAILKYYQSRFS